MRMIIPAIGIVILLCLCTQVKVEKWQYFRAAEEHARRRAAAWTEQQQPTTQPTTQPADSPAAGRALD